MTDYVCEAARLLLSSMHKHRHADRRRSSFVFTQPGQPPFSKGGGIAEVNFDRGRLLECAVYIRKHGAPHLMNLPVSKIERELILFVTENYYIIAHEALWSDFAGSYADNLYVEKTHEIVAALGASHFFRKQQVTVAFPIVPIRILDDYIGASFFLRASDGLAAALGADAGGFRIIGDTFPPIARWDGARQAVPSWLGVRAPTIEAARKVRASVLGAVALLPQHDERYMFSGRKIFGGEIIFRYKCSFCFGEPHTPPIMRDITIDSTNRYWINQLEYKFTSESKDDQKHLLALEYFYQAWTKDPVTRFPLMFFSLDAIFGDVSKATQAVVDAVSRVIGSEYTADRIRLLLHLRASVVHGGAPNVYESKKYHTYYQKYGKDAIEEIEMITATCLQQTIFPG